MKRYCRILAVINLFCFCMLCMKASADSGILARSYSVRNSQPELAAEDGTGSSLDEPPKVAITFDDGPNPEWTPVLLEGLKERGVKATFFLIGKNAQMYPEIVKQIYEEGHLIGNHTFSHARLTSLPTGEAVEEIEKTNQMIYDITGEVPQFIRPPYGDWNDSLDELDLFYVKWNIDTLDWTTDNVDYIVHKAVSQAKDNSIILLHDNYKSSVEAALRIVDELQSRGFEFVTVEEILLE